MRMIPIIMRKYNWQGWPLLGSDMKIGLIGLSAVLFGSSATANTYGNSAELDPVVTTGTRTAKTIQNSPVAVDYIDAAELKMVSSGTLAQAMEYVPGVIVTQSTKYGYNVSMMGFGSDKVLVLIDGQRLISTTNTGVDLDQISAKNIDHIEIIRGPASVLYGSSAMGGVINVITKKIEENQTSLSYEVGSYGNNTLDGESHNLNLTQSLRGENIQGRLGLQYLDDPGYDYDLETEQADGTATEKLFVDAQINYQDSGFRFSYHPQVLTETRNREDNDLIVPGVGAIEDGYESKIKRVIQDVAIEDQNNAWVVRVRHAEHDETSGRLTSTPREALYGIQNIDAQKIFSIGRSEIATGIVWDKESLDSPEDEIHSREAYNREGFAQWDFLVSEDFELLAGIRTQESDQFGGETTGRISTRLSGDMGPGNWTLRAGLAESYKVPTIKEQYYLFDHSNVGYIVVGNQDLRPESAVSKTLSLSYDFHAGHHLEFNFHQSMVKNLIETELNEAESDLQNVDVYLYQNISKARIEGVDSSWEHLLNDRWSYSLNYSYFDKRESNGQRIFNSPRNQFKANLNWHYYPQRMQVLLYLVHQSDVETDRNQYSEVKNESWTTTNLSVRQSLNNELAWRFAIENIFDEHRDTSLEDHVYDDRPRDSRKVSLGLTYEF